METLTGPAMPIMTLQERILALRYVDAAAGQHWPLDDGRPDLVHGLPRDCFSAGLRNVVDDRHFETNTELLNWRYTISEQR